MHEKNLDSIIDITYSYAMTIMNLLTPKQVLRAAWHVTAVAEGDSINLLH